MVAYGEYYTLNEMKKKDKSYCSLAATARRFHAYFTWKSWDSCARNRCSCDFCASVAV